MGSWGLASRILCLCAALSAAPAFPARPPPDCPRLQRVVSGRAQEVTRKLAEQYKVPLDAETRGKLTEGIAEVLKDYMTEGRFRNDKMGELETRLVDFLTGKGVDGQKAKDFVFEWMDQVAGLIDPRFPVIPLRYEIPADIQPHWDLVRSIVGSKEWGSLNATDKANPAEAFRKKERITRGYADALPPEHARKKPLTDEADGYKKKAEAFQKVAEFEAALYKEVPPSTARGFPYGFGDKRAFETFAKSFVDGFKKDFGETLAAKKAKLDLKDAQFYIFGSSLTGLSHERKADGLKRPFGPHSDLDLVIVVPDEAFAELRKKGLMNEEEPGKRSIPYSLEATEKAIREMGLQPLLKNLSEGLSVKKISIAFYSKSYYDARSETRPYQTLTP